MTPIDAHTWLCDQYRRLLAVAEAATPGPWDSFDGNEGTGAPLWMVANDAFHTPSADEDEPWIAVEIHTGIREDAEHISTFNPTLVSAICKAALELLGRHDPCLGCEPRTPHRAYCHRCATGWPCVEVLSLAAPFVDLPDFPEELRHAGA